MKKIVFHLAAILCAGLFAQSLVLCAQNPAPAQTPAKSESVRTLDWNDVLKNGFSPLYRISSSSIYTIESKDVTDTPVRARRLIYSGYPFRNVKTKDPTKQKDNEQRIEYCDVLLIPVDSGFQLNQALIYAQPDTDKESADYFFLQYGISWRKLDNGLYHFTVYVGKTNKYYVFASANILFLLSLQEMLQLKEGFEPEELLAKCLSIHDLNNISAEAATQILPKYKNAALPYVKESISEAVTMEEPAFPQFRVLVDIVTPESVALINDYAQNSVERKEILLPLFDAIVSKQIVAREYKPVYQAMLRERVCIPFASHALTRLKENVYLQRTLMEIVANPENYDVYKDATVSLFVLKNPKHATIHKKAEQQMRYFLVRNGEVPGTSPYYNIFGDETMAEREARLQKKDSERLQPVMEQLLQAPERDLTMIVGLNLALTEIDDSGVSPKYVTRVRSYGFKLLKAMPDKKPEMEKLFRALYNNAKDKKSRDHILDTAQKLGLNI